MDLAEFLLARLADDFEVAQRESAWPNGKPRSPQDWEHVAGEADSMLVGMFSPARVLAEVEAKRELLGLHPTDPLGHCRCQEEDGVVYGQEPCLTKRLLALPFAEHPECHPSWLPAVMA